jgi:hypothetical protein
MAPLHCEKYVRDFVDRIARMCRVPLRRHVSALHWREGAVTIHDNLFWPVLSAHMPHLRELTAPLLLTGHPVLTFPPQLVSLALRVKLTAGITAGTVAALNLTIAAVAGLGQLQTFSLRMPPTSYVGCSLAPLAHARQLHSLRLMTDSNDWLEFDDAQVADLRSFGHLELVNLGQIITPFDKLLAPPHTLRWRSLSPLPAITEANALLLLSLPLHTLDASAPGLAMPRCDWLAQLTGLTELSLGSACEVPMETSRILQAISGCRQLRSLTLLDSDEEYGLHFTSAQLGACLPCLPQLRTVRLGGATELKTLAFLVLGNSPPSLTALRLEDFVSQLPVSELKHVLQLRELRSLELIDVFDAPLEEADRLQFEPPLSTERMPHLTQFVHVWTG